MRTLKLGAKGQDVFDLQMKLKSLGFDPAFVDGDFGAKTDFAVKAFQVSQNLLADGIVGPQTSKALGIEGSAPIEHEGPNPYKRGSVAWYEFLYKSLTFDKGTESRILSAAKSLLPGRPRYEALEKELGVPWTMIATIHKMEGDGNFETYLGNGQSIHRVTTIVPKGRGPFKTFEDGARDALKLDGLMAVKHWTLGLELKYGEQFNGLGYFQYHPSEFTPYLFACSNINDGTGKYTSDGHYDPNANANTQVGVATQLKQLELLGLYKPVFLSITPSSLVA